MDRSKLAMKTRHYWDLMRSHQDIEAQLEIYISDEGGYVGCDLLAEELAWMTENPKTADGNHRLPTHWCQTLAVLVGFSIEPLLQSIWVYQPDHIILLLNQQYIDTNGYDFGQMVVRLITYMYQKHKPDQPLPKIDVQILEAQTLPVFSLLQAEMNSLSSAALKAVVMDVTGGKKRMVSEAFLYAAYANIDVSYVDFDDDAFDPRARRPFGFAAQIGRLQNPYQAFALRDWERVKQLYKDYSFREAKAVLEQLQANLAGAGFNDYLGQIQAEAIPNLVMLLDCYEAWDSGNFNRAKEKADELDWLAEFPSAITNLGGDWFKYDIQCNKFINAPHDFYANTTKLTTYVYDELKRVGRLYRAEDYRSTFLRAAALSEVIIVGRLIALVENEADKKALSEAMVHRTPGIKHLSLVLLGLKGREITIGSDMPKTIAHQGAPDLTIRLSPPMNRWWHGKLDHFAGERDWEDFLSIRNQLAHAYFSVSASLAKDALAFVKANFEDFLDPTGQTTVEQFARQAGLSARQITWSTLCYQSGLAAWLPPNLVEDV